ncbi:MAG: type II secretion system protein [Ruminococcus sp.]|nr:type II secretion system protein [Ruminococcus sp.]
MKTTKKGFTLIELIVVIAIIGVLAAILVPTMLGYVKKSKISSANQTAASIYKAINSALVELDEEGVDVGGDWEMASTNGGAFSTIPTGTTSDKVTKKITNFFAEISKTKEVKAKMSGGTCKAVAAAVDSTYIGTFPAGVVTTDTFDTYKVTATDGFKKAYEAAVAKAGC